ncbi:nuclear transport factor 2 family protein [Actinomycetospora sp. TBRC 11914]|uniref:nuclear transport factor 2 family protein n=1 Tax=Actinomycetospora sp. TBRC 11914 TaxID=2729387 RepID=UPI00145D9FA4|nr:nuclear transport factor 2 family protein [Actinomycetospora sp. TBRC 11914]NMO88370.1 nuclear transport factor 2 family protein [Actinomycetospora sp. TBRC 11914]
MATPTPTAVLTAEDRLDLADTLAGFAAGIDERDPTTLGAVFTDDATLDFGPAARAMGIDFPVLEGRQGILDGVAASVGPMDTLHTASNVRVLHADGDGVRVTALVHAIHHPPGVRDRHCTMHNRYDMTFVQTDAGWQMSRLVIENRFWSGDAQVMLGA